MIIRMQRTYAGDLGVYPAGMELELDDRRAKLLIASGDAKFVRDGNPPGAPEPEAETTDEPLEIEDGEEEVEDDDEAE